MRNGSNLADVLFNGAPRTVAEACDPEVNTGDIETAKSFARNSMTAFPAVTADS
jgi:hypothetical protein